MNPDPASLDRLHDLIAPTPVPWWPPAPGWIWLLGLVVAMMAVALLRGLIVWQRNRYRREALAELARQQVRLARPEESADVVATLSVLLKRTALCAWPRREIASLHGPQWFAFLDRTGRTERFSGGCGDLLESVAYDPREVQRIDETEVRELTEVVAHWLRHHRVESEDGRAL